MDIYIYNGYIYGYIWIYMDIYGYIWIYMDIYGYIWIYLDIYIYIMDIYRYIYIYNGYIWIYMDIYGYIRIYMDIYGYIWMYMDIYGYVYIYIYMDIYVDICGYIYIWIYMWIYMWIFGYIWIYMYMYTYIYIWRYIYIYIWCLDGHCRAATNCLSGFVLHTEKMLWCLFFLSCAPTASNVRTDHATDALAASCLFCCCSSDMWACFVQSVLPSPVTRIVQANVDGSVAACRHACATAAAVPVHHASWMELVERAVEPSRRLHRRTRRLPGSVRLERTLESSSSADFHVLAGRSWDLVDRCLYQCLG